jgi:hypothetical protein
MAGSHRRRAVGLRCRPRARSRPPSTCNADASGAASAACESACAQNPDTTVGALLDVFQRGVRSQRSGIVGVVHARKPQPTNRAVNV